MIYETKDYEVLITKNKHRQKALSDLSTYCIRHKTYKTIEAAAPDLPTIISNCNDLQAQLNQATKLKGGTKHGATIPFKSENNPL